MELIAKLPSWQYLQCDLCEGQNGLRDRSTSASQEMCFWPFVFKGNSLAVDSPVGTGSPGWISVYDTFITVGTEYRSISPEYLLNHTPHTKHSHYAGSSGSSPTC